MAGKGFDLFFTESSEAGTVMLLSLLNSRY
jgi:hypothetical protein